MNERHPEEMDEAMAAVDEALLQDAFDETAPAPSDAALARLAAAAARMPADELVRRSPGSSRRRRIPRRAWAAALAAALATVVGAGLYSGANETVPKASPIPHVGTQDQIAGSTSPDGALAGEAVPGWDDETSRLEADADALAMLDGDPLAAFDGWQDEDLFATDARDP